MTLAPFCLYDRPLVFSHFLFIFRATTVKSKKGFTLLLCYSFIYHCSLAWTRLCSTLHRAYEVPTGCSIEMAFPFFLPCLNQNCRLTAILTFDGNRQGPLHTKHSTLRLQRPWRDKTRPSTHIFDSNHRPVTLPGLPLHAQNVSDVRSRFSFPTVTEVSKTGATDGPAKPSDAAEEFHG